MENINGVQTPWERLEYTRNQMSEVLEQTKDNKKLTDQQLSSIQQELIIAMGGILTFSNWLAKVEN